jgi:hypothetical protein
MRKRVRSGILQLSVIIDSPAYPLALSLFYAIVLLLQ